MVLSKTAVVLVMGGSLVGGFVLVGHSQPVADRFKALRIPPPIGCRPGPLGRGRGLPPPTTGPTFPDCGDVELATVTKDVTIGGRSGKIQVTVTQDGKLVSAAATQSLGISSDTMMKKPSDM